MTATHERLPPFAAAPVTAASIALGATLTALSGRYGFHRDELYFLAAGDRLAWGYVDQPPLTPMLASAATSIFGDTPSGLRVAATAAYVGIVVVVALIARELGGGRYAQVLAACGAGVSGFVLAVGHMVSTSTFDVLVWVCLAWAALRLARTGDGRWWLAVGATAGIGLLNKYLVVLLAVALLAAWVITGPRRVFRSWWLVGGIAAAAVIAAPNLWWQAAHDWPQLTVAGGISADDGAENRIMFVPEQLVYLSAFLVPVWAAGLWRLWRDESVAWAKAVGLAYPILCVLVVAVGGKGYYATPLLLVLLAAGCQPAVEWLRRGRVMTRRVLFGAGIAAAAASSAVISLPVLPPTALTAVNEINKEQGEQVGWPSLASAVSRAWSDIPPAQRDDAVIFTQNYAEAGAIEHYGAQYGLPQPYSGHMSYADWGPPPDTSDGAVLLVYQDGDQETQRHFTDCEEVARVDNPQHVDNGEQNAVAATCTGTTAPWSTLWPRLRHYY
ncbi:MAG: glycosyltransferase family 39 protein [Stackebrandtia sp.]